MFRGFIQGILGLICVFALLWTICTRLVLQCDYDYSGHGYIPFDLSLGRMIPFYIAGMLILFCGLVMIRTPQLTDEVQHGPDLPYGTIEQDRTGIWGGFLFWLPALPNRNESYLWSLTLLGGFLTFILRDQSLNWMISLYGFRDWHTTLWDWISLICAPIAAIVITIYWLALWRLFISLLVKLEE